MKEVQFEWYVLNEVRYKNEFDDNYLYNGNIKPWNIFNNYCVNERTNLLCREYKSKKMTFEDFKERLRSIIMCEEWSRCEYEIMVESMFAKEGEPAQKIDCYSQVLPNLDILAKHVLRTYYPRIVV